MLLTLPLSYTCFGSGRILFCHSESYADHRLNPALPLLMLENPSFSQRPGEATESPTSSGEWEIQAGGKQCNTSCGQRSYCRYCSPNSHIMQQPASFWVFTLVLPKRAAHFHEWSLAALLARLSITKRHLVAAFAMSRLSGCGFILFPPLVFSAKALPWSRRTICTITQGDFTTQRGEASRLYPFQCE